MNIEYIEIENEILQITTVHKSETFSTYLTILRCVTNNSKFFFNENTVMNDNLDKFYTIFFVYNIQKHKTLSIHQKL